MTSDVCGITNSPVLTENSSNSTDFSPVLCTTNNRDRYSIVFFIIGNMLIGFGASPLLPIGASYLDDIIMPKYVPIHLGLAYAAVILGPALGFGLGSAFLSVYVDFWEDTNLEQTDPAYVGAWWIGFLLSCFVCCLISIPILMFPKLLSDSHIVENERQKKMAKKHKMDNHGAEKNSTLWGKVLSIPHHFWQIVSTLSWLFITAAIAMGSFAVQGLASFSPLYYETQFNLTSSSASVIGGAVGKLFTCTCRQYCNEANNTGIQVLFYALI